MKILVMCLGNINRSALAAAMLSRHHKCETKSAGFLEGGRRASPAMREYARGLKINLDGHRSQQVTEEHAMWADMVLFMNPSHIERFHSLFPKCSATMVNLAEYMMPSKRGIPDPAFDSKNFTSIVDGLVMAVYNFERKVIGL